MSVSPQLHIIHNTHILHNLYNLLNHDRTNGRVPFQNNALKLKWFRCSEFLSLPACLVRLNFVWSGIIFICEDAIVFREESRSSKTISSPSQRSKSGSLATTLPPLSLFQSSARIPRNVAGNYRWPAGDSFHHGYCWRILSHCPSAEPCEGRGARRGEWNTIPIVSKPL